MISGVVSRGELSSITSSLDEIARRVSAAAEEESGSGHDALATDLFAVERSLREALRRMARLT
jgi:hypothetical protein